MARTRIERMVCDRCRVELEIEVGPEEPIARPAEFAVKMVSKDGVVTEFVYADLCEPCRGVCERLVEQAAPITKRRLKVVERGKDKSQLDLGVADGEEPKPEPKPEPEKGSSEPPRSGAADALGKMNGRRPLPPHKPGEVR